MKGWIYEDTVSYCTENKDIVGNSAIINNSDNEAEDKVEDNDGEVENNDDNTDDNATDSSNSEFEFTWCDVEAIVEPDMPNFHKHVGISSKASSAKSSLDSFKVCLHECELNSALNANLVNSHSIRIQRVHT